jgi:hypothetical protein
MKPVPDHIAASGPEGTEWFGGSVDRSIVTLRVICDNAEVSMVAKLLGCESDAGKRGWQISTPASEPADVNAQVQSIFSKVTADLAFGIKSRLGTRLICSVACSLSD